MANLYSKPFAIKDASANGLSEHASSTVPGCGAHPPELDSQLGRVGVPCAFYTILLGAGVRGESMLGPAGAAAPAQAVLAQVPFFLLW
jgi:hypothetical protein